MKNKLLFDKICKLIIIKFKYLLRITLKPKIVSISGVKINLESPLISLDLKKYFYNESYEGHELNILKNSLCKNDIVLEVGAGIGFISTFSALQIGSERVFAYEANPEMVLKINETYKLNDVNPVIKNAILSNTHELVNFYLEPNFWSSSTTKRSNQAQCINVQTININKEILKIKPTFLILDIEGGEVELIPLIKFECNSIKFILIEMHPHIVGKHQSSSVISCLLAYKFCIDFNKSKKNVLFFEREV